MGPGTTRGCYAGTALELALPGAVQSNHANNEADADALSSPVQKRQKVGTPWPAALTATFTGHAVVPMRAAARTAEERIRAQLTQLTELSPRSEWPTPPKAHGGAAGGSLHAGEHAMEVQAALVAEQQLTPAMLEEASPQAHLPSPLLPPQQPPPAASQTMDAEPCKR